MRTLIKLDRLSAWILLIGMVLYFISGFGMAKGFISYELASQIHLDILTVIILLALTFHGAFATRLALIRWRYWNSLSGLIWVLFFTLFLAGMLYLNWFYQPAGQKSANGSSTSAAIPASSTSPNSSATANNTSAPSQPSSSSVASRIFSKTELAKYNGRNSQPSYVAVDGVVYDLSSVFRNGSHAGFSAGSDQSAAFHSHHYDSILSGYEIVGRYQP